MAQFSHANFGAMSQWSPTMSHSPGLVRVPTFPGKGFLADATTSLEPWFGLPASGSSTSDRAAAFKRSTGRN
jgi:hypothetical protein